MDRKLDRKLILNTEHRTGGFNYQAEWEIQDHFMNTMRNGYQIALIQFMFKNLRYPTNTANNRIYFSEGSPTVLTGIIEPGNYLPSEYGAAIKAAMEAVGGQTYTVTLNNIKDLYTISSTGTMIFYDGLYTFHHQFGLKASQLNTLTAAASITAMEPYILNGSTGIYVRCLSGPITSNYSSAGIANVWEVVPNAAGYGETLTYSAVDIDPIHVSGDSLRHIRLDLLDEYGNAYILPENVVVIYVVKIIPIDGLWSEDADPPPKRPRTDWDPYVNRQ